MRICIKMNEWMNSFEILKEATRLQVLCFVPAKSITVSSLSFAFFCVCPLLLSCCIYPPPWFIPGGFFDSIVTALFRLTVLPSSLLTNTKYSLFKWTNEWCRWWWDYYVIFWSQLYDFMSAWQQCNTDNNGLSRSSLFRLHEKVVKLRFHDGYLKNSTICIYACYTVT